MLVDKTVLENCKKRRTNLYMAWLDHKEAYDFVPFSWINKCMELFGSTDDVRNFLEKSMEPYRFFLVSNGEYLGQLYVKREIFQGDIRFEYGKFVIGT